MKNPFTTFCIGCLAAPCINKGLDSLIATTKELGMDGWFSAPKMVIWLMFVIIYCGVIEE